MRHFFSYYSDNQKLEIPSENAIGVFGPLDLPHSDREKVLSEAFANPVNSKPLRQLATPLDTVLIVVDDGLEPTPTVFPFFHVIQELHAAGVKDSNISVLLANGSHRPSTNAEADRKIGAEMHRKYKVYQSSYLDRHNTMHSFGTAHSHRGVLDVSADARIKDASLVVGITGTYPSRFKGFSGAGSLIFPGVASPEIGGELYMSGAELPAAEVFGKQETPARKLIAELLQFVPAFQFCAEVVLDHTLQLVSCVTGDPGSTYRVSADVATRMFEVSLPEPADILVIDSHPFDHNLFQAFHALYAGAEYVKNGGEILLMTPLLEALSHKSAGYAAHLSENRDTLVKRVSSGAIHATGGIAHVVALKEVLDHCSRVTVVTHGAGKHDAEKFGMQVEANVQEALDAAIVRKGAAARVAVITHGGLIVPKL